MILLYGVGQRRLSKHVLTAVLVAIAVDSGTYAWKHVQAIRAEIRMRAEIHDSLDKLMSAAEQIHRKP